MIGFPSGILTDSISLGSETINYRFTGSINLCPGACPVYRGLAAGTGPVGCPEFPQGFGFEFTTDPISFNAGHFVTYDTSRGLWRASGLFVDTTGHFHTPSIPASPCIGGISLALNLEAWFLVGCNPPAFSLTILVPLSGWFSCPFFAAIYSAPMKCADGLPSPGVACSTLFTPTTTQHSPGLFTYWIMWPSEYPYEGDVDLVCA